MLLTFKGNPIILIHRKSSFLHYFDEYLSNEGRRKLFFFPGLFFFAPKIDWMNDIWTFTWKGKKQQTHKIAGEKI